MKFFGAGKKSSSKSNKHTPSSSVDERDFPPHQQQHSDPPSPTKSSSSHKSPKKSSRSESSRDVKSSSSRHSRLARHSTEPSVSSSSSRKSKLDLDTHPLNLPPEERKRFSALSRSATTMSGRNSMDIDPPVNGSSGSPRASAQANFSVPISNGSSHEEPPVPPPHKSTPSSPDASVAEDAETFKAAGNKFFKEKSYAQAIEQYSKGKRHCQNIIPSLY